MNIDKVGGKGEKYYDRPLEAQGEINNVIPFEIFERILSNLDGMDIQQASLVGHLWSVGAIDMAKQKEFSIIKDFTHFLCHNLPKDSCADQRKALLDKHSDTKMLDSVNLLEIKTSIHGIKEILLNIVKDLSDKDLNNLEGFSQNVHKPLFFENFFELANLYKQIDVADKMPDGKPKDLLLLSFVRALVLNGHFDKAIEVANKMTVEYSQWKAHEFIINALIQKDNLDKAIEVIHMVAPEVERGSAIMDISKPLLKKGQIKKILELIPTLSEKYLSERCLAHVSILLTRMGNVIGAIEIGNMIEDAELQEVAFEEIEFVKEGAYSIDDAIKIAEKRPEFEKDLAFRDISRVLAKLGEFERALAIAHRISDESLRGAALKDMPKKQL